MIFDDISAELLFTPSLPAGVEDPQSLPAVTPAQPRAFTQDDGTTYQRVRAVEFEDGDQIDSTTVEDPGAPA